MVDDQVGRLTFTDELARAVRHLLETRAAYGTWNVTNGGPATSWADVARLVFELRGRDPADVRPTSTEEYAAGKSLAPRPARSGWTWRNSRRPGSSRGTRRPGGRGVPRLEPGRLQLGQVEDAVAGAGPATARPRTPRS